MKSNAKLACIYDATISEFVTVGSSSFDGGFGSGSDSFSESLIIFSKLLDSSGVMIMLMVSFSITTGGSEGGVDNSSMAGMEGG